MFYWPFELPFMLDRGISTTQIVLLFGIWSLVQIFFEVPSGYLADRFGRRHSMLFGALLFFAGVAIEAHSYSFWAFALAHVVIGVGNAMESGADTAIHYDTLSEAGLAERFSASQAILNNFERAGIIVAFSLAGLLANWLGVVPLFYISLGFIFARVILIHGLEEVTVSVDQDEESGLSALAVLHVFRSRALLAILSVYALVAVAFELPDEFVPVLNREVELPIVLFGLWGCIVAVFGLLEPWLLTRLARWSPRKVIAGLSLFAIAMFAAGFGCPPLISPAFLVAAILGLELSLTLVTALLNDHAPSSARATVNSAASMVGRVFFLPFGLVFAQMAEAGSIQHSVSVVSIVATALAILALALARPRNA